jgi:hypothetical protein
MEQLGELARQYWYVIVGGIGVLLILGAVFKWKWALQHEGDRPFVPLFWVFELFGAKGYRIAIGIIGAMIVIFTAVYAVLLEKL